MKISDAIQSYLVASNLREESTRAKKFYISDMGKCQRMRWLKRKGVSTELTSYVYWIFAMGNMIHNFGYKALEAQSLLIEAEKTLDDMDHWSGRFDGLVKNNEDKPAVFDFKSAGGYAMKKAIAGADNEENIKQILTYTLLYGKTHPEVSDTGILVYMNKEPGYSMPMVAFDREYHLTDPRIKEIELEMSTMVGYWVEDTIPPCTCPGWMRNYNSFLPFCLMKEAEIRNYLIMIKDNKKITSTKTKVYSETIGDLATRKEVFSL